MNRPLPEMFINRTQEMLGAAAVPFLHSYQSLPTHGLRVNPGKVSAEWFAQAGLFSLTPVEWCPTGFRFPPEERPGKHPYHACGLYYLQEPSAMAVAEALDVQPDDVILDLCAAPGGKSTQIAGKLGGSGLLVANEIHPTRAKALSENIERLGIVNALVTNESPERLQTRFTEFFDKILVDAPCSGEGMFRKLPEAIDDWSPAKVSECHAMQLEILAASSAMLKPGGRLVYSTCTFAPLENEQTIASFLHTHPQFSLQIVPHHEMFVPGEPAWATPADPELAKTARLWPHLLRGEGHFIAVLQKDGDHDADGQTSHPSGKKSKRPAKPTSAIQEAIACWQGFARESVPSLAVRTEDSARFTLFGEQLYYSPLPSPDLASLRVVRPGWHLGTVKKNRFEPSHALALSLHAEDAARTADYAADAPDVLRYLRGESLTRPGIDGWTLVTVDSHPLGWGKQVDGQLKNHYPKGLRWL